MGKSLVTSLLASEMNKRGYKVAILDADITGLEGGLFSQVAHGFPLMEGQLQKLGDGGHEGAAVDVVPLLVELVGVLRAPESWQKNAPTSAPAAACPAAETALRPRRRTSEWRGR